MRKELKIFIGGGKWTSFKGFNLNKAEMAKNWVQHLVKLPSGNYRVYAKRRKNIDGQKI